MQVNITGQITNPIVITSFKFNMVKVESFNVWYKSKEEKKAKAIEEFASEKTKSLLLQQDNIYFTVYSSALRHLTSSVFALFPFTEFFPN